MQLQHLTFQALPGASSHSECASLSTGKSNWFPALGEQKQKHSALFHSPFLCGGGRTDCLGTVLCRTTAAASGKAEPLSVSPSHTVTPAGSRAPWPYSTTGETQHRCPAAEPGHQGIGPYTTCLDSVADSHKLVLPATQEAEARGSVVQGQFGQETLSQNF